MLYAQSDEELPLLDIVMQHHDQHIPGERVRDDLQRHNIKRMLSYLAKASSL